MAGRLSIISPAYLGDGTGSSVYYQLLTRGLRQRGWCVQVISESAHGTVVGVDDYVGLFPPRASLERRLLRDVLAYARQNLTYFELERHVARFEPDVVLVHSSFANFPGAFSLALGRLAASHRCVLDVRDVLFGPSIAAVAERVDHVISCSDNVTAALVGAGVPANRITMVPVPQEPLWVSSRTATAVQRRHGLQRPYLLYAGMLKEVKGVDTLIRAFAGVVRPRRPQYELVLAGRAKWASERSRNLMHTTGVRALGSVSRRETVQLMAGADLVVNPSQRESIGRSSLEALAVGAPVVLPANVLEFARSAPHVIARPDAEGLGRQIVALLDAPRPVEYDLSRHDSGRILDRYEALLGRRWASVS